MDVILKYRYTITKANIETLKESLIIIESPAYQEIYLTLRDSVIRRFRYSIDTLLKLLKSHIIHEKCTSNENLTSEKVLLAAENMNLIDNKERLLLLKCNVDRRDTAVYNAIFAEELVERIPLYYEVMSCIIQRIKMN